MRRKMEDFRVWRTFYLATERDISMDLLANRVPEEECGLVCC
jgi:hypothetical protein